MRHWISVSEIGSDFGNDVIEFRVDTKFGSVDFQKLAAFKASVLADYLVMQRRVVDQPNISRHRADGKSDVLQSLGQDDWGEVIVKKKTSHRHEAETA